jgi:hypothetical protein
MKVAQPFEVVHPGEVWLRALDPIEDLERGDVVLLVEVSRGALQALVDRVRDHDLFDKITEDATDAFGQTIKESHLVAPFISRLAQDLAQILRSEQGGVNPPSKPTVALVTLRREKRAVFAPRRTVSTQM